MQPATKISAVSCITTDVLVILSVVLLGISLFGCVEDAPRDNPFDPESEGFVARGAVSGAVTDRARAPVRGARVDILSEESSAGLSFLTETDVAGRYALEGIQPGTYWIRVSKEGYVSSDDTISVSVFETTTKDVVLNGVPFFERISATSAHISRVWPPPTEFFLLDFAVQANDIDGLLDLSRIWFEIPSWGLVDTLHFSGATGEYSALLQEEDLSGRSIHDVIGRQILFFARDRFSDVVASAPVQVSRIIEETPVVIEPKAGTVDSLAQPVLVWRCEEVPYDFSYSIEVVRTDDIVRNTITTMEGRDPQDVCSDTREGSIRVDVPLPEGNYLWTVSLVDRFGNSSRSREAGFAIRFDL